MLNSTIAMKRFLTCVLFLYLILLLTSPVFAQAEYDVVIQSPAAGQAVQGLVPVTGNTDTFDFLAYDLSFASESDPTQTWFTIKHSEEAVRYDILGEWDTTTLTDGSYSLRLTVALEDQEPVTVIVAGIRVRNYTPIETNTPAPTTTLDPGATPTSSPTTSPPTPTPLPANLAIVTPNQVRSSIICGAISGLVGLIILGFYVLSKHRR